MQDLSDLQKAFVRKRGYNPASFGYDREEGLIIAPGLGVTFRWPKKGDSVFETQRTKDAVDYEEER